jgi:hypothetical protein
MKKFAPLASLAGLATTVAPVFAAGNGNLNLSKPPGFQIEDLGLFVSKAIGAALVIAAILVFVYLVWGGIQWITSGGDKGKTEEARNRITAALVGLAIVAAAWAVVQLVSYFFGIDVFGGTKTLPTAY